MKPLWALAGIAVLGTAGIVGAIVIASPGGEEEVAVQNPQTTSPGPPTATTSPATSPTAVATPSSAATAEPSPDAVPSDWETYTDAALGFSLRYPPDLVFRDLTSPSQPSSPSRRHLQFRSPNDQRRSFTIGIIETDKTVSLDEWVQEFTACLPETIRDGLVDGERAIFCTSQPASIPEQAVAFQLAGSIVYVTSTMPSSEFEAVIGSVRL